MSVRVYKYVSPQGRSAMEEANLFCFDMNTRLNILEKECLLGKDSILGKDNKFIVVGVESLRRLIEGNKVHQAVIGDCVILSNSRESDNGSTLHIP